MTSEALRVKMADIGQTQLHWQSIERSTVSKTVETSIMKDFSASLAEYTLRPQDNEKFHLIGRCHCTSMVISDDKKCSYGLMD